MIVGLLLRGERLRKMSKISELYAFLAINNKSLINYTLYAPIFINLLVHKRLSRGIVGENYTPTIPQLYP